MSDDHTRPREREGAEPVEQFVLSGMGAESSHRVDRTAHDDPLAKDGDRLRTVNELSTKGSGRLKTHNQDCRFRPVEIVLQMVHDPPASVVNLSSKL